MKAEGKTITPITAGATAGVPDAAILDLAAVQVRAAADRAGKLRALIRLGMLAAGSAAHIDDERERGALCRLASDQATTMAAIEAHLGKAADSRRQAKGAPTLAELKRRSRRANRAASVP